jgi:hypothetical protein
MLMMAATGLLFETIFRLFRTLRCLLLENLALRQHLAVFKQRHPRPQLVAFDKLFWVLARRFWSGWKQPLIVASPETVVRWVESCRRDLLDHVIALNGFHLKRLLSDYVRYYHDDRTHLGLGKETPGGRLRSVSNGHVIGGARLGGLPHRYDRAA